MHYIETSSEYAEQAVTEALQEGQWLIGCMADDPHEWSTYTLENVFRYEGEGHWASSFGTPTLICHCISPAIDGPFIYRLHDDVIWPIFNNNFEGLIHGIVDTYDVIVIEEGMVDRNRIYGKLGNDHADEVVFVNNF